MKNFFLYLFKPYRAAGVVGLTGIALSISASLIVYRWQVDKRIERFEQQSTVLVAELQRKLDSYSQLTRSMGAFFNAHQEINNKEFQNFSETLLPYYDGLLGLGWIEEVKAQERLSYEQRVEEIREFDDTGNQVIAGDRSIYFPTTYIEPWDQLQAYIGWDAASDPKRLLTLEKAKNLELSISSPLVKLENGNPGFIIYYPVFSSDRSFQGAVFGSYELQTWIESAIANLSLHNLDFYIYALAEDQLDSALNKTTISAKEGFLIAYKADSQTLTKSPEIAELAMLETSERSRSPNHCPYRSKWQFCIRSIHMERQELSLLVLPTSSDSISSLQATIVLIFGLFATSSLVMYLLIANFTQFKVESKNKELEELLQQLQQAQLQLVQTEKMSSLGRLVAGVAHEINNPVNFISGNVDYARTYFQDLLDLIDRYQTEYPHPSEDIQMTIEDMDLDFIVEDLPNLLDSMKIGTERLREIILSLRNFSRLDESEVKDVDIHTGIESTLMILSNRLKAQGHRPEIKITKDYSDLPAIACYAGQLNQVFMNILGNGIDALEEYVDSNQLKQRSPTIQIKTSQIDNHWIAIHITDNGPGIPAELQTRLFDPFFTTKPIGKGTGLGLSISYQIITEKHKGYLLCSSEAGKGTEFIIKLPISSLTESSSRQNIGQRSI